VGGSPAPPVGSRLEFLGGLVRDFGFDLGVGFHLGFGLRFRLVDLFAAGLLLRALQRRHVAELLEPVEIGLVLPAEQVLVGLRDLFASGDLAVETEHDGVERLARHPARPPTARSRGQVRVQTYTH